MPVSNVFFRTMARAILTGFMQNPNLMQMLDVYTNLKRTAGTNVVDVPIWSSFTVHSMGSECLTPCDTTKKCNDPTATLLHINLITRFIPTPICLADLNIMSIEQKAGMIAKVIQDLARDFEIGVAGSAVADVLFTDATFNGPGGNMAPIVLTDTAAGYRLLANGIAKAKGKDSGGGVAFIVSPDMDGFIKSIPSREIDRMLDGVNYIVMGNFGAFACNYWGTTYTGKASFVYPKDALAYAAPAIKDPNIPLAGYAGNMWTTMLDDTEIPGKMLYFAHQYGLMVVRAGDVQMFFAP